MGKLFLSHTHRDQELADRLQTELDKLGLESINPISLEIGEDWRKEIREAIKRADAVLLLAIAPEAVKSSWMGYEAGIAEALDKQMMVVATDRLPVSDLPVDFVSWQIVRVDPTAPARAAREIAEKLAPHHGLIAEWLLPPRCS